MPDDWVQYLKENYRIGCLLTQLRMADFCARAVSVTRLSNDAMSSRRIHRPAATSMMDSARELRGRRALSAPATADGGDGRDVFTGRECQNR